MARVSKKSLTLTVLFTYYMKGLEEEDWKPEKEPNMDEEIELIKKWVKEREDFINE